MLLCGDIGGTKTTLALFDAAAPRDPVRLTTYPSQEWAQLSDIVAAFLGGQRPPLEAACFGVAGPVRGKKAQITNLPWVVDADRLSACVGGAPVVLINDLEALAWGVTCLPSDETVVLNPGRPAPGGAMAVIAAGTGLGQAGLVWSGDAYVPFASEGGHSDFAPRSEREIGLLRHLSGRWDHVSWERVVSGPGIVHLFEYLRDVEHLTVPDTLARTLAEDDLAPAITQAALAGTAEIAVETLALFVTLYGAEAGNLALKLKSTGGVWVGGGIAPKILPLLEDGRFQAAFLAKGRFRDFLADVPVRVVLDQQTPLYGAACAAARGRR
jgi:glucokinase